MCDHQSHSQKKVSKFATKPIDFIQMQLYSSWFHLEQNFTPTKQKPLHSLKKKVKSEADLNKLRAKMIIIWWDINNIIRVKEYLNKNSGFSETIEVKNDWAKAQASCVIEMQKEHQTAQHPSWMNFAEHYFFR